MSESDNPPQPAGLVQCFDDFSGTYCVRKLVELILSSLFLLSGIIILSIFIYKYRGSRPFWLTSILLLLISSLIANICFCFFNELYWLYALENFLYNTYYLILVSYICYAYVLKHRVEDRSESIGKVEDSERSGYIGKVVFFCIVGLLLAVYFAIFIVSLIYEIENESQEISGNTSNIHYCQQIWYMVLNVICILLSGIVVGVMLKSQQQQYSKLVEFNHEQGIRQNGNITSSDGETSLKASSNNSYVEIQTSLLRNNINNPFRNLWIWVGINVVSQIINLIQAGLELQATPPQCLLVATNPTSSNILSLVFVFFTMYLGYGATLWYIVWVKIVNEKTRIDRSVLFSEECKGEGNIQLFVPSKEETITFQ